MVECVERLLELVLISLCHVSATRQRMSLDS